jgi:hypothetical protein
MCFAPHDGQLLSFSSVGLLGIGILNFLWHSWHSYSHSEPSNMFEPEPSGAQVGASSISELPHLGQEVLLIMEQLFCDGILNTFRHCLHKSVFSSISFIPPHSQSIRYARLLRFPDLICLLNNGRFFLLIMMFLAFQAPLTALAFRLIKELGGGTIEISGILPIRHFTEDSEAHGLEYTLSAASSTCLGS